MRNGFLLPAVALFTAASLATAQTIPSGPTPVSPGQMIWPAQPVANELRWPAIAVPTAMADAPPAAKDPGKKTQDVVGHPVADVVADDATCHGIAVDTSEANAWDGRACNEPETCLY